MLAAAALAAPAAVRSSDGRLSLVPPAGWASQRPGAAHVLFRLRGPLGASALVTRVPGSRYLYNRAAVSLSLGRFYAQVDARAGLGLRLGPALGRLSLPNGAEADYRVATAPGRPSLALALCRFSGHALIVQVVSSRPEEDLRALAATLAETAPAPAKPARPAASPGPGEAPAPRLLTALWLAALGVTVAAGLYFWRELRRPGRREQGRPCSRSRREHGRLD